MPRNLNIENIYSVIDRITILEISTIMMIMFVVFEFILAASVGQKWKDIVLIRSSFSWSLDIHERGVIKLLYVPVLMISVDLERLSLVEVRRNCARRKAELRVNGFHTTRTKKNRTIHGFSCFNRLAIFVSLPKFPKTNRLNSKFHKC